MRNTTIAIALSVLLVACGDDDAATVTYAEACADVCPGDTLSCVAALGCSCIATGATCSDRNAYCERTCEYESGDRCPAADADACEAECGAFTADVAWCPPPTPGLACGECPVSAACVDAGCECDDGTACVDE